MPDVRIAELMEATGLEKGGIYRHFTGKEELAAGGVPVRVGAESIATRDGRMSLRGG